MQSTSGYQPSPICKEGPSQQRVSKGGQAPSPQAEKTTPEPSKPLCPTSAQSLVGAGSTPTSPTHMTSCQDATNF
jgi:hypothetical protein